MNKANLRLTINSRCKCAIEYFEVDLFKFAYVLFKGRLEITYLEKVLDPRLCLFEFFFFGLNSEHFMLDYLDLVGLVGVSKNQSVSCPVWSFLVILNSVKNIIIVLVDFIVLAEISENKTEMK